MKKIRIVFLSRYALLLYFLILVLLLRINGLIKISDGDRVLVNGVVVTQPTYAEYSQRFRINGIFITLDRYPQIEYLDKVTLEGVYYDGAIKKAKLLSRETPYSGYVDIRERLITGIRRTLSEPHASLVSGVSFGRRIENAGLTEKFRKTGTSHIVVASGTNVSYLIIFLTSSLTGLFSRKKVFIFCICFVWFYVGIVSFEPPIVRAALMGTLALLAMWSGRQTYLLYSLVLIFVVMLIVNPYWFYDFSFWLSFLSTSSLAIFERKVYRLIHFVPLFLRSSVSTSLAAQFGVAPLLLYQFGEISLIGPVVNSLVLWTVPYITMIGMLGSVFYFVSPFVGFILLSFCYPFTYFFYGVVDIFS